jgi:hypothetical protein
MSYFGAFRAEGQQATDKFEMRDRARKRLHSSRCAKEPKSERIEESTIEKWIASCETES